MSKIFIVFCFAFILAGCTHSEGRYAFISSQPMELTGLLGGSYRVADAKAVSRRHVVMFIPFSQAPTAGEAVRTVLEKYHGDYLANAEIKQINRHLMYLYHYKAWEVSGTVMRLRRP